MVCMYIHEHHLSATHMNANSPELTFACRCALGTVDIVLLYAGLSLAPLSICTEKKVWRAFWARFRQIGESACESGINY